MKFPKLFPEIAYLCSVIDKNDDDMKLNEEEKSAIRSVLEDMRQMVRELAGCTPLTDAEIRIYCLELSRERKDFLGGEPDMEKARMYYDFLCPSTPSMKSE